MPNFCPKTRNSSGGMWIYYMYIAFPCCMQYLLLVLSAGGVSWVNEGWDVSNEHSVEGGPYQHADNCHPHFCGVLGWESAEPNTQHVWDGLEYSPGVLDTHTSILEQWYTHVHVYWGATVAFLLLWLYMVQHACTQKDNLYITVWDKVDTCTCTCT